MVFSGQPVLLYSSVNTSRDVEIACRLGLDQDLTSDYLNETRLHYTAVHPQNDQYSDSSVSELLFHVTDMNIRGIIYMQPG